jgi:uncharacterized membrane protein YkvA (DUF1232 family)
MQQEDTSLLARLRRWSRALQAEALALYFAGRDPRTPLYAKLVIVAVAAYAMSPIDLIPDFIPVLGYLDDLIIVPAGLALAVRLVPDVVLLDCRARAAERLAEARPRSMTAAVVIVCVWVAAIALTGWLVWQAARPAA